MLLSSGLIIILLLASQGRHFLIKQDREGPGFPFEIKHESLKAGVPIGPLWEAAIVISQDLYSKENLDRLFLWYGSRHKDRKRIEVKVFTDLNNMPIPNKPSEGNPILDESLPTNSARIRPYDAVFWREIDTWSELKAGELEWYSYSIDLNNPNNTMNVILKGRDPHAPQMPIDEWETSSRLLKIRVRSYELKRTEPSGFFYTFYYTLPESDSSNQIMTMRLNEKLPISEQQVRFVNDQFVYMFMAWKFAATIDGGRTWFGWDAESEIPDYHCCDQSLIRDVQIAPDGTGTMTLVSVKSTSQIPPLLRTKDFGKHWSAE